MKKIIILLMSAFMCLSTYGQDTYTGKIFHQGTPLFSLDFPPVPCPILWLETTSGNYILSIDSHWIVCNDQLIVDGIEYNAEDEVEITGTVRSSGVDIHSIEHFTLEIETIKKQTSSIQSSPSDRSNVYFDAINQTIVIDETLKSQGFMFELTNIQGKVISKKTNGNIHTENLPSGIYLYRLLQDNQTIRWGKIVK